MDSAAVAAFYDILKKKDLHCTVTQALTVFSYFPPLLAMQTYSPASFLLLLEMFNCLVWDKVIPDFSHLILGSGKPEASQLKNRGVDVLTVIFCGTSVNWTGTR